MEDLLTILRKEGTIIYPFSGISMYPLLDQYEDAVRLNQIAEPLKPLDVALFTRDGNDHTFVLHRVMKVRKNGYLFCGDNQKKTEYVPKENVVAVMAGYFKNGQYYSCDSDAYRAYMNTLETNLKKRKLTRVEDTIHYKRAFTFVLQLLSHALGTGTLPEGDVDWSLVFRIARQHKVLGMVAGAAIEAGAPAGMAEKFSDEKNRILRRNILFDEARKEVTAILDKEGIPYLCLKGIKLKHYYPSLSMRESCDQDILVPPEKALRIHEIMTSLGYRAESKSEVHDVYLKEPVYNFEIHKKLFGEGIRGETWFSDVWGRLAPQEGTFERLFTPEEEYVYFLTHYYKHYSHSGAGLRFVTDLICFKKHLSDIHAEPAEIGKLLQKTGLSEFEAQMSSFAETLVSGDVQSLDPSVVREIQESQAFGTMEKRVSNEVKEKGKARFFLGRLFLPYKDMKTIFPWLRYVPFLLPIAWLIRMFRALFSKEKRSNIRRETSFALDK